jgi:hypothetical protein
MRPITHDDYLAAARVLWGDAGAFVVSEYNRHNFAHFAGELPAVPMVIGITPYGRCIGHTRSAGGWDGDLPRITIASNLFAHGTAAVSDTILHEMIHVKLMLEGRDPSHNGEGWCEEVMRLSPAVLGRAVKAAPVKPRRVDGKVTRHVPEGFLGRDELAGWPGHRTGGAVLPVASS